VQRGGGVRQGRVYLPQLNPAAPAGLAVALKEVELLRLEQPERLTGQYVEVRNGGNVPAGTSGCRRIENASPDANGDFLFRPGRGGARMDRADIPEAQLDRYVEAAHFAEVNTYFHLDRIAHYIHGLLGEIGAGPLPRVIAVTSAHNGCLCGKEIVDGKLRKGGLRPMQGGHYRLPGMDHDVVECEPLAATGEIHLGSGQRRLVTGALAQRVGKSYRHNTGHNAGTIYHEYGHHVHRHTADFRANNLRPPVEQSNRKVSMDEGTCDYWAAAMLDTPHIWAWHRRHDEVSLHRRSLTSLVTMADYDYSEHADPHVNGTIWAAGLWAFRSCLQAANLDGTDGGRLADKIVLQALVLIGRIHKEDRPSTCRARSRFRTGLRKLLEADHLITGGRWQQTLLDVFNARGITTQRRSEVR
jgi:hypothetical protein